MDNNWMMMIVESDNIGGREDGDGGHIMVQDLLEIY